MSDRFNTTTLRGKTGTDPIDPMPSFRCPSALDLLTQFRDKYGAHVHRRIEELRKEANGFMDALPTPDLRNIYAELDSLHYFEPELHRLIQSFVAEAVKPLQDVLVEAMMRVLPGFCTNFAWR